MDNRPRRLGNIPAGINAFCTRLQSVRIDNNQTTLNLYWAAVCQKREIRGLPGNQNDLINRNGFFFFAEFWTKQALRVEYPGTLNQDHAGHPAPLTDHAIRTPRGHDLNTLGFGFLQYPWAGRQIIQTLETSHFDMSGTASPRRHGCIHGDISATDNHHPVFELDCLALGYPAQKFHAPQHIRQIAAFQRDSTTILGTDAQKHGIITVISQLGEREIFSQGLAGLKFDPEFKNLINFLN